MLQLTWEYVGIALEGDPSGAGLILRRLVAHDLGADLRRDPGMVEPGGGGVPCLVKTDRLQALRLPAMPNSSLQASHRLSAAFANPLWRTNSSRARSVLGHPLSAEKRPKRGYKRNMDRKRLLNAAPGTRRVSKRVLELNRRLSSGNSCSPATLHSDEDQANDSRGGGDHARPIRNDRNNQMWEIGIHSRRTLWSQPSFGAKDRATRRSTKELEPVTSWL